MDNVIDRLHRLFNVNKDADLADVLGLTRQSIYSARKKDRISRNILKTAASRLNMPEAELRGRLYGDQKEDIGLTLIRNMSTHINRMAIELGKLREQNERLAKENAELRYVLRKVAPDIEAGVPMMDEKTLFERLDTDDMAYIVETIGHIQTLSLYSALEGKNSGPLPAALEERLKVLESEKKETLEAISKACRCISKEQLRSSILQASANPLDRIPR